MSLSAEQLELRKRGIGASEIGGVLGLSPYDEPLDIYMRKAGLVPARDDSEAMAWGRALEPAILERYASDECVVLDRPGTTMHPRYPYLLGTPDAVVRASARGVEAKTCGHFSAGQFGESGSDQIPPWYLAQCAVYMSIFDYDRWDLCVLIGGQDYRVFRITRDRELESLIAEEAARFWRNHVLPRVPPEPTSDAALGRYLAAKYPRNSAPLKGASAEAELYAAALRDVRAERKYLEEKEERLEMVLKEEIGNADGLITSIGEITYKQPKSRAIVDWEAVARNCDPSAELITAHTSLAKASRRFLVKF